MAEWKWTPVREAAAVLCAADELSNAEIASESGVSGRTLDNWKATPEFSARVEEIVDAYRKRIRRRGIAIIENRVAALDDRWKLLLRVIEERAADETIHHVPGGKTGLIVRQVKFVKVYDVIARKRAPTSIEQEAEAEIADPEGDTEDFEIYPTKRTELVEEFAVDTGLLSEIRAHEQQAAKELGQWVEKQKIDSRVDVTTKFPDLQDLSAEELARLHHSTLGNSEEDR